MSQPLSLAVRSYLLRKNLVAIPFEVLGASAALLVATSLIPALLYLMVGDLVGDQIGRRVAQASSALDDVTGREIKALQISKPWRNGILLLLVPCVVAFATWQSGFSPNQIVGWAGIAWSAAHLAYRFFAFLKERNEAVNA